MRSLFLRSITNQSDGSRINRRFLSFIICIVLSAFFWLLLALSKEYTIVVRFPVKYINLPKDKIISNHLPETIDMDIQAGGFDLLTYQFNQQRETIVLDINDAKPFASKNHYFLLSNSHIDKITAQFNKEIKILKINPDTVYLNYNKKMIKRVPVKVNLSIAFNEQYQLTDSIRSEPETIEIAGAADILDKISYVETVPVSLKNVSDAISLKLAILKTPEVRQVELSDSEVFAKVSVTKFTEASLELPIEVDNLPHGFNLKTFPDKVVVKYNVAFDDYGKINSGEFKAIVDYLKIEPGSNKLKVQLVKFPPEIRAVKLSDEKVEYIIRK